MKESEFNIALMLGGNVGETPAYFKDALSQLETHVGEIDRLSAIYRSEPWGHTDQSPFLNQAVIMRTWLNTRQLLQTIQFIENSVGQKSEFINGPREIDIDILLYGFMQVNQPDLQIPHPRLHVRLFNLMPLAEIAPDWIHPGNRQSINQLLMDCKDELKVEKDTSL